MRVPFFVILGLAMQATLAAAAIAVWFVGMTFRDGSVVLCVDCLGEGWFELVLFTAVLGFTVASLAWALVHTTLPTDPTPARAEEEHAPTSESLVLRVTGPLAAELWQVRRDLSNDDLRPSGSEIIEAWARKEWARRRSP